MNTCKESKNKYINKLTDKYIKHAASNKNTKILGKNKVKQIITKWFKDGKENTKIVKSVIKKLVSHDKEIPIWWSGFWVEDPNIKTNPKKDMIVASNKLNGYSSIETPLSVYAPKEQDDFWTECFKKPTGQKFSKYQSTSYTVNGLKDSPKNIFLFLNKEIKGFKKAFFYKVELPIIDAYYKKRPNVNLHIFNLKDNCSDIEKIIIDKFNNVNVKCYSCLSLSKCAKKYIKNNKTKKRRKTTIRKKIKYKKINSRKTRKKQRKK